MVIMYVWRWSVGHQCPDGLTDLRRRGTKEVAAVGLKPTRVGALLGGAVVGFSGRSGGQLIHPNEDR